jgi:hypothetical protein
LDAIAVQQVYELDRLMYDHPADAELVPELVRRP